MGRQGFEREFKREWSRPAEGEWRQYGGHGRGRRRGEWGGFGGPGGPGMQGPPPWVAGLFGMGGRPDAGRGPRVRRGDVRSAILDVLRAASEEGEQLNGYQVIQRITERSDGAWKPSPGSVYPTVQQLQDEGLVESDDDRGRKTLGLTATGATYVVEHADDLASVWRPFDRTDHQAGEHADLKPEIGQVMGAIWQIASQGSESQRQAAVDVLVDARRRLYGILADGHDGGDAAGDADEDAES